MNRYERRSSIWLAFLKKKEIEPAPSGISIPFSRSSISISLSSPSLILPDENELTPSLRRARIRSLSQTFQFLFSSIQVPNAIHDERKGGKET